MKCWPQTGKQWRRLQGNFCAKIVCSSGDCDHACEFGKGDSRPLAFGWLGGILC